MLFRSRRYRHTSSEVDARRFCDVEFQDPTSDRLLREVSVYRIEPRQVVQCQTEHFASVPLGPANSAGFDLEGLPGPVVPAPIADSPFRLRGAAHHNIHFRTDDEVLEMAALLREDLVARTHEVTKAQMREYVGAAVRRRDPEWEDFLGKPGAQPGWRALAREALEERARE